MRTESKLIDLLASVAKMRSLPDYYVNDFIEHIAPIVATSLLKSGSSTPQVLAVQGCQGSGKSTLCEFLKIYIEHTQSKSTQICSVDDFYLTRLEREKLSKMVHPLLATRGVPGTHDTNLIHQVFDELANGTLMTVPIFEKENDDRAPKEVWPRWDSSPSVLIFEGWCVGVPHQAEEHLQTSVNDLEELEDNELVWRRYVNQKLQDEYQAINARLDTLLTLQAPSFDCVFDWRRKQESAMVANLIKLGVDAPQAMNADELKRFISHYQRLTEYGFNTLPRLANAVLYLNHDHSFERVEAR